MSQTLQSLFMRLSIVCDCCSLFLFKQYVNKHIIAKVPKTSNPPYQEISSYLTFGKSKTRTGLEHVCSHSTYIFDDAALVGCWREYYKQSVNRNHLCIYTHQATGMSEHIGLDTHIIQ